MALRQSLLPEPETTGSESYAPSVLVVELTRRCNLQCRHCVVSAGPDRPEVMQEKQMIGALDDAAHTNFQTAIFYGGEPFLEPELLFRGIDHAYKVGIVPQITTNGYWGKDKGEVCEIFARIESIQRQHEDCSPLHIGLSTDPYHHGVPPSSHARIISEHLRSPADVSLTLVIGSIGNDSKQKVTALKNALDAVDQENKEQHIETTLMRELSNGGKTSVRFIDRWLKVPVSIDPATLLRQLEEQQILSPDEMELCRRVSPSCSLEMFEFLRLNNLLQLVQTPELKSTGEVNLGRLMPGKSVRIDVYPVSLIGRGRALLKNSSAHRRTADYRQSISSPDFHLDRNGVLIVGADHKFYVSPIHLAHGAYPLGENGPDAMRKAIIGVNAREHTLSTILLERNFLKARMFASMAGDVEAADEIRRLEHEGLEQEALETLLLSPRAIAKIEAGDTVSR